MLTDTQWPILEPLVEQCRPKGKTPPQDLLPQDSGLPTLED
jgi:hypothetical protein